MAASDYVEAALELLGSEDTEFMLAVVSGHVAVQCRYQGCNWGESCGEIELWEFVVDARDHWDTVHGN